jgi:hypothetical protein
MKTGFCYETKGLSPLPVTHQLEKGYIMPVKIAIAQIQLQSGQTIILDDISWSEFTSILEDLGERHRSRIAYYQGVLEISMPLPEHERSKVLISHLLVILKDFHYLSIAVQSYL